MARFRRRTCTALLLFTVFIFGTMMVLRTLRTADVLSQSPLGSEPLPIGARMDRCSGSCDATSSSRGHGAGGVNRTAASNSAIFYDVHIFYFAFYGNPPTDGKYIHWDHALEPHWDPKIAPSYPRGRHVPPEDIGSSFYPELSPYSSRDPEVLDSHMQQIEASGAGVLVLSWYPPGLAEGDGEPAEDMVPAVLDAAHRRHLKVAFHLQPYRGRNEQSVHDNVKYIIDRYGDHGAFYRFTSTTGRSLPLFYIYDSYLTPPESWAELLTPTGSHSLRTSAHDSIFIALMVEERHKHDILAAGFDGMYTYFASNGFSYGSSHQNWGDLRAFCNSNDLLFIPSVGPGYIDTSIRPWNNHNTRNRVNGRYYETALQAALDTRPEIVTITSFNEWHEGTQIERAVPKKTVSRLYLDYQPHGPDHYLELTRRWAEQFNKEKERWLM